MKFRVEVVCISDSGESTAAMHWKWNAASWRWKRWG